MNMREHIECLFEAIGFLLMAAGLTYAVFFVVGETVEHFTR